MGSFRAIVLAITVSLVIVAAILFSVVRSTPEPRAMLDKVPSPFVGPRPDGGACVCARGDPLCECL